MVATQDPGGRRPAAARAGASPARVTGGIALMVAGVALTSYGVHFVAKTGTCSGTGYVSYGPVARCPGNEALYITSAFFVGPVVAIAGWLMARAWGWLWPAFCLGIGAGLVAISDETTASAGARAFGLVGGVCLFGLAGLSVVRSRRKRRRLPAAGEAAVTVPAPARLAPAPAWPDAAPAWPGPAEGRAAAADRPDPLATIARLAQLRDSGALTEDEFEIQKARLLAEL